MSQLSLRTVTFHKICNLVTQKHTLEKTGLHLESVYIIFPGVILPSN